MKKYLGTIALNATKICGASWIGFLVAFIPLYIMRGEGVSTKIQDIVSAIICGVSVMVALFLFFIWEGRKKEFMNAPMKELLFNSAAPVLLWALVGSVLRGDSFLVLTYVVPFCNALTGIETADFRFFTPFPFALLFGFFYAVAIFLGYWYGRKHQKW